MITNTIITEKCNREIKRGLLEQAGTSESLGSGREGRKTVEGGEWHVERKRLSFHFPFSTISALLHPLV